MQKSLKPGFFVNPAGGSDSVWGREISGFTEVCCHFIRHLSAEFLVLNASYKNNWIYHPVNVVNSGLVSRKMIKPVTLCVHRLCFFFFFTLEELVFSF